MPSHKTTATTTESLGKSKVIIKVVLGLGIRVSGLRATKGREDC